MSIIGQREIRGDVWLELACGHSIRKVAYSGECCQCPPGDADDEQKASPKPRKPKKSKEQKPKYTPYKDGDTSVSSTESSDCKESNEETKSHPESFFWKGKERKW